MGRQLISRLLGGTVLRQSGDLGLADPDAEIAVHLDCASARLDVTQRFSIACAEPLLFCIALDTDRECNDASLVYSDRRSGRMLGRMALKYHSTIDAAQPLLLFGVRGAENFCLPPIRLASYYLLHAFFEAAKARKSDTRLSIFHRKALAVAFIRPHSVALVSLQDKDGGNMFPMNLMGSLGERRVGLALQVSRFPSKLVARAGRVAVSTVPMTHAAAATKLSPNHRRESIDFSELAFPTSPSSVYGIPVPQFALRVRELKIESVRPLGSHAFIVGSVVSDQVLSREPALCTVHGFYQVWREANHAGG
jgi:flavin reductase (DIM6/NTAB) family NADH-FMN oxidoreductase RutF